MVTLVARGDRRGFVVLHHSGETLPLHRFLGDKQKDIRAGLGQPEHVQTVDQARGTLRAKMTAAAEKRVDDLKAKQRKEQTRMGNSAKRLKDEQQTSRQSLQRQHQTRQKDEAKARADRIHSGLMGLWDRGYLIRFYVELDMIDKDTRASDIKLTKQDLIAQAQKIFHPYKLDVKEVAWWSIYSVGQRIADRFDNRSAGSSDDIIPRAFVAGDACHTHSPKGGWGLNTSLPDTFNLGWKMAAVLKGQSDPKLLATYSSERRKVAQQLINADKELSKLVATRPSADDASEGATVNTAKIETFMKRQSGFVSGTSIKYSPSYICTGQENQDLAAGYKIGQRFHSAEATRVADGAHQHLGHLVKADGRWRIYLFAGTRDPTQPSSDAYQFIYFLANDASSPVLKYTPKGTDIDSVIDTYAVFQQQDLLMHDLHGYLWPAKGKYGLRDYEKVFHAQDGNELYDLRGIERNRGCVVIVRPDQHIASILPVAAHAKLSESFDFFMIAQT